MCPTKVHTLDAVVLEKLFDQTKKVIKNTLSYLTIFSLVFSSVMINTANAADIVLTGSANYGIADNGASGGTVTMVTAPGTGGITMNPTNGAITAGGIEFNSSSATTLTSTGSNAINLVTAGGAGADIVVTDDAFVSTLTLGTDFNIQGSVTNTDNAAGNNLIISIASGKVLDFVTAGEASNAAVSGAGEVEISAAYTTTGNINITGNLDINGAYTVTGASIAAATLALDANIAGTATSVNISGASVLTGNITTNGSVTLTGQTTVNAGARTIDTSANANANITFGSGNIVTDADRNLVLTMGSAGVVEFDGSVTLGTGNLTITGGANVDGVIASAGILGITNDTNIGANITTDGAQTYGSTNGSSDATIIDKGSLVTLNADDSDIVFFSTLNSVANGANALTVDAGTANG